jgi:hypothetical protein
VTATCEHCGATFAYDTCRTGGNKPHYCPGGDCRAEANRRRTLAKWHEKYSKAAKEKALDLDSAQTL